MVAEGPGEFCWKDASADARLREDHRDRYSVQGQRCCNLGADESAADHAEAGAAPRERAQVSVVVERAEIDDVFAEGKPSRPAPGREQEPLVGVELAPVVQRLPLLQVERDDPPPQLQVDTEVGGATPNRTLGIAFPERLREGRARVRRMLLVADEHDRPFRVHVANALAGGVTGQAAADDQILSGLHSLPRLLAMSTGCAFGPGPETRVATLGCRCMRRARRS